MADNNFGYEEKGLDGSSDIGGYAFSSIFQIPEGGVAKSISLYLNNLDINVKVAIYDSDLNLLATGTGISVKDDWATIELDTNPELLEGAYYWLVPRSQSAISLYYATEVDAGNYSDVAYNDFPADPLVLKGTLPRKSSIYCTYTPTPAGWSGKVASVTNPAKVLGVGKANIKSIIGVE